LGAIYSTKALNDTKENIVGNQLERIQLED